MELRFGGGRNVTLPRRLPSPPTNSALSLEEYGCNGECGGTGELGLPEEYVFWLNDDAYGVEGADGLGVCDSIIPSDGFLRRTWGNISIIDLNSEERDVVTGVAGVMEVGDI